MKKKKIQFVLILSVIVMAISVAVSYFIEAHTVVLPAVIHTDKVVLSSEVDGLLKRYYVSSMQSVKAGDLIAEIDNNKLPGILENLKKEKSKYEELITSAKTGDLLTNQLHELDADLLEYRINMEESKSDLHRINAQLKDLEGRHSTVLKRFEASKRMYDSGLMNNSDFEKASKEYWDYKEKYSELQADSLIAREVISSSQNLINLINSRKQILTKSTDVLASKHVVDINKVEAEISELQAEVQRLQIFAPISGIVTDINYNTGERVDKGDVVAELADLSNVWVVAYGSSENRHRITIGNKVLIQTGSRKKIWGEVSAISPIMEKIQSLSSTFETVNTYNKIEIQLEDQQEALKYITPGERLFVRIFF
ncbi:MAG: HlyD family efflux transporter periplasmic adaptor subunit [Candidatus Cloacimonetes bacterium]|nr:HlyD family efflux transporter periplasmic adaptor subunit [Candidatus Cloacimonadota bacterium]